jgi:hypothetical protein
MKRKTLDLENSSKYDVNANPLVNFLFALKARDKKTVSKNWINNLILVKVPKLIYLL